MKHLKHTIVLCLLCSHLLSAQNAETHAGAIVSQYTIDENTIIYEKETGKQIPYQQYQLLTKDHSNMYRTEPVFNEFGEISGLQLRRATPEENADGKSYHQDLSGRPKPGEPIALFVMKGLDGKTYRSADLKGNVILLNFWLKLSRPFWYPNQGKMIAAALTPYLLKPDFISLGILDESSEDLNKFTSSEALPFIPVPKSYGFHKRYGISSTPTFIVIDKSGKVAELIEGTEPEKLKAALEKAYK
jgi:peroxiredoxin